MGICRIISRFTSASSPEIMSVSTSPGATQFTRIPLRATSRESDRVMAISAPLAAE